MGINPAERRLWCRLSFFVSTAVNQPALKERSLGKTHFEVRVINCSKINELKGGWADSDYKKLAEELDCPFENNASIADLKELCEMYLSDLEPMHAAQAVLTSRLSGRLSKGQIQNTAGEFADERFWEHFADLSMHEAMFNVGTILYNAFPNEYYEPIGAEVLLHVTAKNTDAKLCLPQAVNESFLVRLLADGMPSSSILHRLFDDQLAGDSLPEASSIVWSANVTAETSDSVTLNVLSSHHWLGDISEADTYESSAYADSKAG